MGAITDLIPIAPEVLRAGRLLDIKTPNGMPESLKMHCAACGADKPFAIDSQGLFFGKVYYTCKSCGDSRLIG